MKEISLSVIIPCFDEMANLQKGVLDKVKTFLDRKKISYEIIIVDDGSKDGSIQFIEKFSKEYSRIIVIKGHHRGKAGAVTTGMLSAKGEYRLFIDMDQATPIDELDKFLPYMSKNVDVIIGSRSVNRQGSPLSRIIMSRSNIILRKIIVGLSDISDTQCGFKIFKAHAAEKIFTKINKIHNGYKDITGSSVAAGFDVEILYIAEKMNFKIKEILVNWLYVETRRVSPIKDSIEGVLALLKIKLNIIRHVY